MKDLHLYPIVNYLCNRTATCDDDIENELDYLLGSHKAKNIEVLEHKLKKQFKDDINSNVIELQNIVNVEGNDIYDLKATYEMLSIDGSNIAVDWNITIDSIKKGVQVIRNKTYADFIDTYNFYTEGVVSYYNNRKSNGIVKLYYEEMQSLASFVSNIIVTEINNSSIESVDNIISDIFGIQDAIDLFSVDRRDKIFHYYGTDKYGIVYKIVKNYYYYHILKAEVPWQYKKQSFKNFVKAFWRHEDYQMIINEGKKINDTKSISETIREDNIDNFFEGADPDRRVSFNNTEPHHISYADDTNIIGARDKDSLYISKLLTEIDKEWQELLENTTRIKSFIPKLP